MTEKSRPRLILNRMVITNFSDRPPCLCASRWHDWWMHPSSRVKLFKMAKTNCIFLNVLIYHFNILIRMVLTSWILVNSSISTLAKQSVIISCRVYSMFRHFQLYHWIQWAERDRSRSVQHGVFPLILVYSTRIRESSFDENSQFPVVLDSKSSTRRRYSYNEVRIDFFAESSMLILCLFLSREDSSHRYLFTRHLVDDKSESTMSYVEFIRFIREQIVKWIFVCLCVCYLLFSFSFLLWSHQSPFRLVDWSSPCFSSSLELDVKHES